MIIYMTLGENLDISSSKSLTHPQATLRSNLIRKEEEEIIHDQYSVLTDWKRIEFIIKNPVSWNWTLKRSSGQFE